MNSEEAFELFKTRRSVRNYSDRKPTRDQIERIIEAACWAPSNHNRQGWKFIVFEDYRDIQNLAVQIRGAVEDIIKNLRRIASDQAKQLVYFAGSFDWAPVMILVMHKKNPAMSKDLLNSATSELVSGEAISAALAVQNLLLAAHALGLGTCLMTAPLLAGEIWNSMGDLPVGFVPTCLVSVGYPQQNPPMPKRKELKHVIEYR
ncbi:MAG: hypothetical protein GY869_20775 [Planctomycetes bacterium]|nr:hypothetical protein [Planctomycetota bacterium]